MAAAKPGYNERAWAIDVITEINLYCAHLTRPVVRAGGEYTVPGFGASLFPDVLLFGDTGGSVVQQGWELKMPDTPITDTDLLQNAEAKARRLGLNSFVVWNGDEAALYTLGVGDEFEQSKSWPRTGLASRTAVRSGKADWSALLRTMLDDINDLLDSGGVIGAKPTLALGPGLFVSVLDAHTSGLAAVLAKACAKRASFAATVDEWWAINSVEHPGSTKFEGLARVNIVNWLNRFLFAHYLKRFNSAAKQVESIVKTMTVEDAVVVFDKITKKCNFLNVFHPQPGQEYVDAGTWNTLVAFNVFLVDFRLENVPQTVLQSVLEGALAYSRKKLAGQFATPRQLADLLVQISVEDRTASVVDPCCGTGTIARAVYDLKHSLGISAKDALASIWGSDKFAFPLQLCSIALSDPSAQGEIIQVFQRDAFELAAGMPVKFTDPTDGHSVKRELPSVHAVVSNLPFVRFEDAAKINPLITACRDRLASALGDDLALDTKSDLYAHLVLQLASLVQPSGFLGVIVSNSWLGTDWGERFRAALQVYFRFVRVVISGQGRWFAAADVVTTILVLQRKSDGDGSASGTIDFVTTENRIDTWDVTTGTVSQMARAILLPAAPSLAITKHSYTSAQIQDLETKGLGWSSLFADVLWVSKLAHVLVPVSTHFEVARGERRGQNEMFYPKTGHGIEKEFLKPVLRTAKSVAGLIASPDGDAFCCSLDLPALKKAGKSGALKWIKKFSMATNSKGDSLPDRLARGGYHWYEMRPDTLADLVVTMNPDKRICVHRFKKRSFVDQRLIRFTKRADSKLDIVLAHALMNSAVGMFLLQAAGFGRGLGALDLNSTKLARGLHMLDPAKLTSVQTTAIINAFSPLLARDVLDLPDELANSERQAFDGVVLSAYGASGLRNQIYASLLRLFEIRQTART